VAPPFRYDRRFELPVEPGELWEVLERTDRYTEWWSWLDALDGGSLRAGDEARCVVRAPLPYVLRFTVQIDEVRPAECVVTTVRGDLRGPARLEIRPSAHGCEARLQWQLELRDPFLRPLATVARPAMRWAHDRIVEMGLDEFRRRAIDGHAPP